MWRRQAEPGREPPGELPVDRRDLVPGRDDVAGEEIGVPGFARGRARVREPFERLAVACAVPAVAPDPPPVAGERARWGGLPEPPTGLS
ncbi:hypothetical protein [Rhizohabitans arisaemae]|uniref:hypothetical protein n=1 Tax=Rhizohabitans arisaemae TaxID=2720610 RepID=UPI0024B0B8E7|nr:hypothetical protein [Rhizohabitans arisaemae]